MDQQMQAAATELDQARKAFRSGPNLFAHRRVFAAAEAAYAAGIITKGESAQIIATHSWR